MTVTWLVGHLDEGVNVALVLRFAVAVPFVVAVAVLRCRAAGGIQGIERLSFRVDSDVRVVLQPASGATDGR